MKKLFKIGKYSLITEADTSADKNKFPIKRGGGYASRDIDIFGDKDTSEQDINNHNKYMNSYDTIGIVSRIVNSTTEQAVQNFYFKGKSKDDLEKLRKELNLDIHFHRVCKCMLKHGGCWVEVVKNGDKISKLKILPPEQMVVVRDRFGVILAYVQATEHKNIIWGKISKDDRIFNTARKNVVVGKVEDIIYYIFNLQAGEKYGTSLIKPALPMINVRKAVCSMIPTIVQRYISPIIHAKVGNEESEPTPAQVENIKNQLKDIYADTEYVTHYAIDLSVLDFANKGVLPIDTILNTIDSDIMVAMGAYPVLLGKSSQGDGGSEVQLRAESRHVKAIQREIKTEFEDKFIIGLGIGTEEDTLEWEITDERELVEHINHVITLKNAGLITPQKANDLLPQVFHEDLPEELKNTNIQTDTDLNKPNPTDPTKSSEMIEGQRVKRDDHRNPLDKKVKKTDKSEHEVKR